jgi:hypothetical protein
MTYDPYQTGRFAAPPKRKRRLWPWLLAAAVALLCGIGGLAVAAGNAAKPVTAKAVDIAAAASSRATAPAAKTPAKAPAKAEAVTVGAGSWEVGSEVKPGTYTTTAQDYCYWARLKGFDGDLDSIIANGNLDAGQRGRITVKAGDKGLELTGDCTWKRAS